MSILKLLSMLKYYFKVSWRNIRKNKLFSVINILGLSIGIALCFIILLYVQNELSYDRFNKNAANIARIVFNASIDGGIINEAVVGPPVAKTLTRDFPQVLDATRIQRIYNIKVTYKNTVFKGDRFAFADANIFNIFTLPFLSGDAQTALLQPQTVVLTKSTAQKYFGKESAVGKTLSLDLYDGKKEYQVTGVIDDIPSNSHFHFDMFGSMSGFEESKSDRWMSSSGEFYTYLLLKAGTDFAKLEAKFPAMMEKYMGPETQSVLDLSLSQFRSKGNRMEFKLQPLTSIHLYSDTANEFEPRGDGSYVYIFGAIAIFILLVACINFINLSTANATKRAKEVGVRKVSGSGRFQLIMQFLSESVMISLFSLAIALIFVLLALPAFNDISGKHLVFDFKPSISFIVLGLFAGIIAGMYPAFYLSSFNPISVLKGRLTANNKSFGLRSSLVVFQFFISVVLIISTIVVYQQMKYIQNKKLGYDKEQLLNIPNSWALGKNQQVFKEELLKDTRIINATLSWYNPAGPSSTFNALAYPEGHDNQVTKTVEYHVDEQYIPTLGMQMAAGRNFSKDFATDSLGMIMNESAVKTFGWNMRSALGKSVIRMNASRGKNIAYHIVGVVKDFHFKSFHEPITPLLMTLQPEGGLIFKVNTKDVTGLLSTMKKHWDIYKTGEPFTYEFTDDLYIKTYSSEQKMGLILNIFSVLTIFVACLGLFGLATYTAERRTKEIGIRKVLGATVAQIIQMLSKEFAKLVTIACLIAFPAAWWAMSKWLQSFAYRIDISWSVFLAAGISALFIALCTISFQAVKAALSNPVESLRTE